MYSSICITSCKKISIIIVCISDLSPSWPKDQNWIFYVCNLYSSDARDSVYSYLAAVLRWVLQLPFMKINWLSIKSPTGFCTHCLLQVTVWLFLPEASGTLLGYTKMYAHLHMYWYHNTQQLYWILLVFMQCWILWVYCSTGAVCTDSA